MSDPRQTGRGAGARAGGESGEDSTLIRSAKDFYGDDSPTDSSRADRVMGRLRGRSDGGKGQDASGGAGPDRSTGAHVDTGAAPNRAASGSRGSADAGSTSPTSGNQASGHSGTESKQPIAAQESKGGRARLGAAAASAGGVVGGLSGRKKSARTGSAAEAVPAPGQSSGGRASATQSSATQSSATQTGQQTRTAPATADSDSEPTRQIPAQGNRSGRAAGAAGGAAAGGAAGAAAARGRADDSHTENTSEPSGLARAETPKKQLGAARRTLKARLRVSQVDPWSVMKTAFLFSFAAGIVLVVAVLLVYLVLSQSGLFVTINQTVGDIISTPGDDTPFDITDYISFGKVLGASFVIGAIDVVIYTALATLGAFLYNLAAATIGGLEVTLAED